MEQLRQAASVTAQGATRGATSPAALSAGVARAQQGTRAANAAQFGQQLLQARMADQQSGQRLLGGLIGAGAQGLAMAIPGGQAAAPIAGSIGNALGSAIGGGLSQPKGPTAGAPLPASPASALGNPAPSPTEGAAPQAGSAAALSSPAPQPPSVPENPYPDMGQPTTAPPMATPAFAPGSARAALQGVQQQEAGSAVNQQGFAAQLLRTILGL